MSYRYHTERIAALGATWINGHYNPGALAGEDLTVPDDVMPFFKESLELIRMDLKWT
jgi:hypothetical protein